IQSALKRLAPDRRAAYENKLAEIDREHPGDRPAGLGDFVDHIDYAVKTIGVDHVGISSDFDGGGGIAAWNDASETCNGTLERGRRHSRRRRRSPTRCPRDRRRSFLP